MLIDGKGAAMFVTRTKNPAGIGAAVLALALVGLTLAACGQKKDKALSPAAAKVNKGEVTVAEINFVLQQQRNLRPEQADAAGRQVLERLIDQELAVEKARSLKLDREPRVVQQLEAVQREVLARAYVDQIGEAAAKPTDDEIKVYFDDNPALFSQRRVYNLQEIQIEGPAERMGEVRTQLGSAKSIGEFVEFLKTSGLRFNVNQVVRAAEQLPMQALKALSKMNDGQALMNATGSGAAVVVVAGSRQQPLTEEQARPAIEQYLLNERKRKLVDDDRKALRATATIEYQGKFAEGAPPAASAPAEAPHATEAPAVTK
jgi:EpsD family peptidyl-prolyl cis-trans isomerase